MYSSLIEFAHCCLTRSVFLVQMVATAHSTVNHCDILTGIVSRDTLISFCFEKVNLYFFYRCWCFIHLLFAQFILDLINMIYFTSCKMLEIFTDFPKPFCCSINGCSKAAWELQIAFLKRPGKSVASENLFVAPMWLQKQLNTIARGLREICENSKPICQVIKTFTNNFNSQMIYRKFFFKFSACTKSTDLFKN